MSQVTTTLDIPNKKTRKKVSIKDRIDFLPHAEKYRDEIRRLLTVDSSTRRNLFPYGLKLTEAILTAELTLVSDWIQETWTIVYNMDRSGQTIETFENQSA